MDEKDINPVTSAESDEIEMLVYADLFIPEMLKIVKDRDPLMLHYLEILVRFGIFERDREKASTFIKTEMKKGEKETKALSRAAKQADVWVKQFGVGAGIEIERRRKIKQKGI